MSVFTPIGLLGVGMSVAGLVLTAAVSRSMIRGEWFGNPRFQRIAALCLGVLLITGAAIFGGMSLLTWIGSDRYAPPAEDIKYPATIAVLGLLSAIIFASTLPLGRATLTRAVAPVALLMAGFGLLAVGVSSAYEPCSGYEFSREHWREDLKTRDGHGVTDAERAVDAIARCGVLEGRTEREIQTMLGIKGHRVRREVRYPIGWINDGIGPGDQGDLTVRFNRKGTAVEAVWDGASTD